MTRALDHRVSESVWDQSDEGAETTMTNTEPPPLPIVPTCAEMVTEDWVERVLVEGQFGRRHGVDWSVTELSVGPGAAESDGFLSRMQRVEVRVRRGGSGEEEVELPLMAKLHPPGRFHRSIVTSIRAFEREIHVYDSFQKLVMEQQKGRNCHDGDDDDGKIRLPIPECYFHEATMDAACIVMEDLKHRGFRMNSKRVGMTYAHAKLCVVAEATFNALGLNAKRRVGLEDFLLENGPLLLEPLNYHFGNMMDYQIFPGNIAFARGKQEEDLAERLNLYCKRVGSPYARLLGIPRELRRRGCSDMMTFGHGDCWNNNYMFRYENDAEENQVPVEVKIVDLQFSRFNHPAADLAAFLLCNLDGEVRDAHLEDLLRIYHETLTSTLDRLSDTHSTDNGHQQRTYTLDDFKLDMESAWEYGFLVACWLLPVVLPDEDDVPDYGELDESKMADFYRAHIEKMAAGISEDVDCRLMDVLRFGAKRGII